jgi:hypothetical protein
LVTGSDRAVGDPVRDAGLARHLEEYESAAGREPSAEFRARLSLAAAQAVRLQGTREWMLATRRYGRAAFRISIAAAAAAAILLSRMPSPERNRARDVVLAAAVGAASTRDLASAWTAGGAAERDFLGAFGVVTP